MMQPCAVEDCFVEGTDKIVVEFDHQDVVFALMVCPDHGEAFRENAGSAAHEVGFGVILFSATLTD